MKLIKFVALALTTTSLTFIGCASTETPAPQANVAAAVPQTSQLLGTKWHYADEQWQYDIEFTANGVLRTTHPNDKTKDNDSWEQNGVNVNFYFNDKFSTYTGRLWSGVLMSGTAVNKKGTTWSWKATRAN